jgi:hypothetical protein
MHEYVYIVYRQTDNTLRAVFNGLWEAIVYTKSVDKKPLTAQGGICVGSFVYTQV